MQNVNLTQPQSLTSASPNNPLSGGNEQQANQSPDLSSNEFSVNNPSIPTNPVPAPSAPQQPQAAAAPQQSDKGSKGGGGILGPIGSVIGIGSKLLAAGGPYFDKNKKSNYAEGGEFIEPPAKGAQGPDLSSLAQDPHIHAALAAGYLVGALHQKHFGGTPDTLPQASEIIAKKLFGGTGNQGQTGGFIEPPQAGFAAGGMTSVGDPNVTSTDAQLAQVAMMRALGLSPGSEDQAANTAPAGISSQTANAMAAAGAGQANPGQVAQQQVQAQQPNIPQERPGQGYVQGFAAGGPDDNTPPLQPGQAFQGEGQVKGPGGPEDDAIPAKLSNGEFVFSAPAVSFFGVDKLVKMNEQGKQGFMQALQQVDQNQQQSQGAPPAAPGAAPQIPQGQPQGSVSPASMPPAGPSQQQPMAQAQGGPTTSPTMRNKTHGYMGL